MIVKIKNVLSDGAQFVYDNILPERIKQYLKTALSNDKKDQLRKYLGMGKKQARMRKINHAKLRMKNLGFKDDGFKEMQAYFMQDQDPLLSDLAGFELALWFLDHETEEDARQALVFLEKIRTTSISKKQVRQRAILFAEALVLMGDLTKAKAHLTKLIENTPHPDLYLALSNTVSDTEEKVIAINQALQMYQITPVKMATKKMDTLYDQLYVPCPHEIKDETKVSVIIPVYEAGNGLITAIESVLNQTWRNIELFIVDDCSPEDPYPLVKPYLKDARVRFLRNKVNSGPYVARNLALKYATGDFVTINDADDWSHPEKIERQVKHLIKHERLMGNTSQQARITEDLRFYRRGKPGLYIFSNMSSFMFRRKVVLDKLGSWDQVRFAADSEFILRIKKVFGEKAVQELNTGPLSFQRQSVTSLTGNSAFGFPGYFMGIRKEYRESQQDAHRKMSLYYDSDSLKRPFYAPNPMLPNREVGKGEARDFDVIYIGDYRESNPNLKEIIAAVKKESLGDKRLGLVQLACFEENPEGTICGDIRTLLHQEKAEMLVYGEIIHVSKVVVLTPEALSHKQVYLPKIFTKEMTIMSGEILDNVQKDSLYSFMTMVNVNGR